MSKLSPDSPRNPAFKVLRHLVRYLRKLKQRILLRDKLTISSNVSFGPNSSLMIPNFARIEKNFSVGRNFFVQTNIDIGQDCLISSDVSFVGNDHQLNIPNQSAYWSGRTTPSTVILEGDNFIGYRATIVGNVRIGKGAIIAAGALVVKDVESNSVYAGVPAKKIKERF
jgi:chloramphenicol O-acetyltransferase type B